MNKRALALAAVVSLCTVGLGAAGATSPPDTSEIAAWGLFAGAPPAFSLPPGGAEQVEATAGGYRLTLLRADGSPFAVADAGPNGIDDVTYYGDDGQPYVTVAGRGAGKLRTVRLRPFAWCGSSGRTPLPYAWFSPQRWWLVAGSVPPYVSLDLTEQNLVNAHTEWETNTNHCGIPDLSSLAFSYQGRIGSSFGRNGYSTIGWGEVDLLGGVCVGAIACTATWYSGGEAVESDTRMDVNPVGVCSGTTWYWVNGDTDCRYDIWHVYAHELGHTAGFGHYDDHSLVMYPYAFTHDVSNRRLGRGDAYGNNEKY
jgi:hypothetical protein